MRTSICLIFFLIFSGSCEQEPIPPNKVNAGFSDWDIMLIQEWQYQNLIIGGDTMNFPDFAFEPFVQPLDWAHVRFRTFKYSIDKSYEFIGLYGSFLGSEGPNYQSIFGYWEFNEAGDTLIHNRLEPFRTDYAIIQLTSELLIREYQRIILASSDTIRWPLGSTVVYREVFVPKE